MKIALTKIDVHNGTLTMEFDEESIRFNIFEAMSYLTNIHSYFSIDIIDLLAQEVCELKGRDAL